MLLIILIFALSISCNSTAQFKISPSSLTINHIDDVYTIFIQNNSIDENCILEISITTNEDGLCYMAKTSPFKISNGNQLFHKQNYELIETINKSIEYKTKSLVNVDYKLFRFPGNTLLCYEHYVLNSDNQNQKFKLDSLIKGNLSLGLTINNLNSYYFGINSNYENTFPSYSKLNFNANLRVGILPLTLTGQIIEYKTKNFADNNFINISFDKELFKKLLIEKLSRSMDDKLNFSPQYIYKLKDSIAKSLVNVDKDKIIDSILNSRDNLLNLSYLQNNTSYYDSISSYYDKIIDNYHHYSNIDKTEITSILEKYNQFNFDTLNTNDFSSIIDTSLYKNHISNYLNLFDSINSQIKIDKKVFEDYTNYKNYLNEFKKYEKYEEELEKYKDLKNKRIEEILNYSDVTSVIKLMDKVKKLETLLSKTSNFQIIDVIHPKVSMIYDGTIVKGISYSYEGKKIGTSTSLGKKNLYKNYPKNFFMANSFTLKMKRNLLLDIHSIFNNQGSFGTNNIANSLILKNVTIKNIVRLQFEGFQSYYKDSLSNNKHDFGVNIIKSIQFTKNSQWNTRFNYNTPNFYSSGNSNLLKYSKNLESSFIVNMIDRQLISKARYNYLDFAIDSSRFLKNSHIVDFSINYIGKNTFDLSISYIPIIQKYIHSHFSMHSIFYNLNIVATKNIIKNKNTYSSSLIYSFSQVNQIIPWYLNQTPTEIQTFYISKFSKHNISIIENLNVNSGFTISNILSISFISGDTISRQKIIQNNFNFSLNINNKLTNITSTMIGYDDIGNIRVDIIPSLQYVPCQRTKFNIGGGYHLMRSTDAAPNHFFQFLAQCIINI